MERTPEEIKTGLECCIKACDCDNNCPYMPEINCTLAQRQDALAYIRQLEAQVPKWISVEDRLPEDEDWVLIWYCDADGDYFYTVGRYGPNEHWCTDVDDSNIAYPPEKITHWAPLPEPPKEG